MIISTQHLDNKRVIHFAQGMKERKSGGIRLNVESWMGSLMFAISSLTHENNSDVLHPWYDDVSKDRTKVGLTSVEGDFR